MKKINLKKLTLQAFTHLPAHEVRITIPTLFTLLRMCLSPFVVATMIVGYWNYAFFFFLIAAVTDSIDGMLARFWNEQTFLGACLDPIADKLLILSCFSTLAFVDTPLFPIPYWFVLFVLGKEIMQLTGAVFIYCVHGFLDVRPTLLGKITTFVQMGFIIWLFACYFLHWFPLKTYYVMLGIMLVFVGASFGQYIRIGLRMINIGYLR